MGCEIGGARSGGGGTLRRGHLSPGPWLPPALPLSLPPRWLLRPEVPVRTQRLAPLHLQPQLLPRNTCSRPSRCQGHSSGQTVAPRGPRQPRASRGACAEEAAGGGRGIRGEGLGGAVVQAGAGGPFLEGGGWGRAAAEGTTAGRGGGGGSHRGDVPAPRRGLHVGAGLEGRARAAEGDSGRACAAPTRDPGRRRNPAQPRAADHTPCCFAGGGGSDCSLGLCFK